MNTKTITLALFFVGLLTTASAFQENLVKSFLLFDSAIRPVSPALIRTKQGSISFTGNLDYFSEAAPEYLMINFESQNVTRILTDISQSCDTQSYGLSRLFYHQLTSTLAYYCAENNTLLILDENHLTVQSTIPVNVSIKFNETKLTSSGNLLLVVGTDRLITGSPTHSHLIKIDLTNDKVIDHVVFDQHLKDGEMAVGYAFTNSSEFIVTSMPYNNTALLYSLNSTKNSYELTQLYNFTYPWGYPDDYSIIPELFIIGNLIITNNNTDLLFFNLTGGLVQSQANLDLTSTSDLGKVLLPALARSHQEDVFYINTVVNFNKYSVIRFQIQGSHVTSQIVDKQSKASLAVGNHDLGDLLLLYNYPLGVFSVLDVSSSHTIYSADQSFDEYILSNTTYINYYNEKFTVYNLSNDALLGSASFQQPDYKTSYFLDKKGDQVYYFNGLGWIGNCTVKALNLKTGKTRTTKYNFNSGSCGGIIIQAELTDSGADNIVARMSDYGDYILASERFGLVNFTNPPTISGGQINVSDFNTLTISLVAVNTSIYGGWTKTILTYDTSSKSFIIQNSTKISNMDQADMRTYYPSEDSKIFATGTSSLTIIDMKSSSGSTYPLLYKQIIPSVFYDGSGNSHLIVSEDINPILSSFATNTHPYLFESGSLNHLPGTNNATIFAKAAGKSSYYTLETPGSSVKVVRLYSVAQKADKIVY